MFVDWHEVFIVRISRVHIHLHVLLFGVAILRRQVYQLEVDCFEGLGVPVGFLAVLWGVGGEGVVVVGVGVVVRVRAVVERRGGRRRGRAVLRPRGLAGRRRSTVAIHYFWSGLTSVEENSWLGFDFS